MAQFTLERRPNKLAVLAEIREIRRAHAATRQRYAGGLPLEKEAYKNLRKEAKAAVRRAWLSRIGRKIDLWAILSEARADGGPRWSVVDPRYSVTDINGGYHTDGDIGIAGRWKSPLPSGSHKFLKHLAGKNFAPVSGFPALPQKVRKLLVDEKIRKRANLIGVLYQPEEWRQVDPDPAVIVEWKDMPGQFFALAVWGPDYPRIMEFVD